MPEVEVWRDIPGWKGLYTVSNKGRIKSLHRKVECRKGVERTVDERILTSFPDKAGYRLVNLYRDGDLIQSRVHRLVATAFIGPCPSGYQVNHIDGNKVNNHVDNLEYVTPAENIKHAFECLGKRNPKGESHPRAKLTQRQAENIRRRAMSGEHLGRIAQEYGVCRQTISRVVNGHRYLKERLQNGH